MFIELFVFLKMFDIIANKKLVFFGSLVNNTWNWNLLQGKLHGFGFFVSKVSNQLLGFGKIDVESDIRISNYYYYYYY